MIFDRYLSKDIPLISEGAEEKATRYHISNYSTSVVIDPTRTDRAYGHSHDAGVHRSLLDQSLNSADALSI